MSYLGERLTDLRRHLDHLSELRRRVTGADALRRDLSLANDVHFSLLIAIQRLIDVSAELSTRRGLRFEDFQEAIRNLAIHEEFPDPLIRRLEPLPELRHTLIYGHPDPERVVELLGKLDGLEQFAQGVAKAMQRR